MATSPQDNVTDSLRKPTLKKLPNKVIPSPETSLHQKTQQVQKTIYGGALKKKTLIRTRRKIFGAVFVFAFIVITVLVAFIVFCLFGGLLELSDYLLNFDQNVSVYTGSTYLTTQNTTSVVQGITDFTVLSKAKTTTEPESLRGSKCDFEDAIACGYRTNSMEWIIDHGSNITTPQYDHTSLTNLGRFVRMNHNCSHCRRRMLMSPWELFTKKSCLRFYYFLAGRKQVALSVRIRWLGVRKWTALQIPGTYRRFAWSPAQIPVDIKGRAIFEFLVAIAGITEDIYIAIDDVEILHNSCPPLDCEIGEMPCPNGGICIANFLFCDGVSDCPDGADEANCHTNTSHVRLSDLLQLPGQGRLEIRADDVWRPLCGAKWTSTEAGVACRMLGYTKVVDTWAWTTRKRSALYRVHCIGNEASLLQCHRCLDNGSNSECKCENSSSQAGISCSGADPYNTTYFGTLCLVSRAIDWYTACQVEKRRTYH